MYMHIYYIRLFIKKKTTTKINEQTKNAQTNNSLLGFTISVEAG